jgi:hypothetical protein
VSPVQRRAHLVQPAACLMHLTQKGCLRRMREIAVVKVAELARITPGQLCKNTRRLSALQLQVRSAVMQAPSAGIFFRRRGVNLQPRALNHAPGWVVIDLHRGSVEEQCPPPRSLRSLRTVVAGDDLIRPLGRPHPHHRPTPNLLVLATSIAARRD